MRRSIPAVFFDFDNTITTCDVLDDMLRCFSKDNAWKTLEEKWQKGEIGTRECLDGQVRGIRITRKRLDAYLSGILLEPDFAALAGFLRSRKIQIFILSDNFHYIVRKILKRNGYGNIPVFANKIRFVQDRLIPAFPLRTKNCPTCAHCKRETLLANSNGNTFSIFIGDGLSDVCPAKAASIVFAKGRLLSYVKAHHIAHVPYKKLKDVHKYLKKSIEVLGG